MAYNYFCPNTECREKCEFCNSKGDLQLEEDWGKTIPCYSNPDIKIKLMGESVSGMIAPRMTKDQIRTDRLERSKQDFIKNTLPTISPNSADGKHFRKKHKAKG